MKPQRWKVGELSITAVVEAQTDHIPAQFLFPDATAEQIEPISGDFLHHPVQCAEPELREIGDQDAEQARATRPAGRVVAQGSAWRFVPEP